jgi:uncharacterized integral membrane protein (TIGR00697 family)
MNLPLILVWICVIAAFSLVAAWYAKAHQHPDGLIALYVILVTFANLAVNKFISFDLGFTTFYTSATVLVFAVTFLVTDIVNERFGRKETQRMIFTAVVCQLGVIVLSQLVLRAKGAPFFAGQAAFETVFGNTARIAIASLISFTVSENLDAYLFQWFRRLTGGKQLWMRNALSSIPAMAFDSAFFTTMAFVGTMPILGIIEGDIAIKWLVGIVCIPFMYAARAILAVKESPVEPSDALTA